MAMSQALFPARAGASKCWRERQVAVADCQTVRDLMPVSRSPDTVYFVTDLGALVGIDYANRVTVVLIPRVVGAELNWRCVGSPSEAIPNLCSGVTVR